ncbi:MAG: FtsX-like permease family protein [Bacteroidetes bacterium]|jgi:lipoprotein-releasing system permease protein|nr:FtsX-like permease family protein [Bacteroidota bacterium]
MNFPFRIAKRYLFAKKSHNAINIISYLSMAGVAVGTMALIIVLSVFNGFDSLIKSLFSSFSPDIEITALEGKSFSLDTLDLAKLQQLDEIEAIAEVVEENALFKYDDRYHIGNIKGIDSTYTRITGLDTMVMRGEFDLAVEPYSKTVIGQGVAYYLGIRLSLDRPLIIYMPKRTRNISYNPEQAFNERYLFPSGMFQVEQEFDSKYIFVPISIARDLLEFKNKQVTALEIKLIPGTSYSQITDKLQSLLGSGFEVKDRYRQNEIFYKTMKSEKWMIFFILIFILILASFNIIGSLTMLIIEKKKDVSSLRSMGADIHLIRKIFLTEGWMISAIGACIGLVLGILISWLQQHFGIVKLGGSGAFIIDAYPVKLALLDILLGFTSVLAIGFLAAWFPIRYITGRYVIQQHYSTR